ncbi:hemin ABC transporter substrate-binding protein [Pseudoalteromonas sp. CO302Y]|uniref:heme/hemin ABC transporter substrate-binding protein n=1 Tax=unclassified Pseudoalteromonas TaxID=194690 RepID=UPI001023C837|nr:hemin ABC transporter substrate-binding protein [Pseudoalteromonas sp. CO302Y]RZG07954.1 hemin ABC transporter substrate-binding protein [Pseudoalteromonas sp. CO133X]
MKYLSVVLLLLSQTVFAEQRIVSAGGTLTEIIYALEKQQSLVGVDQSSVYPEAATELPQVGYYRDLAAEGVLSLKPTAVFALEGAGRPEVLEQIASTGVNLRVYKKPDTVDDLQHLITTLGNHLNASKKAQALNQKIQQTLPKKAVKTELKALFLLSANDRGLVAAGTDTVPNMLFDYAGIKNLAKTHRGFKPLNSEILAVNQPDFIVAPAHVVYSLGGKEAFCKQPSLTLLKAAQSCQLLVMDSLLSLGLTPRIAQAINQVSNYKNNL